MSTRIGFSTDPKNFVSRVIRWFTGSSVSHCFVVYYDEEWKRDMVLESEGGLGGSVRIVKFDPASPYIVKLVTPRHDIEQGMAKVVDYLGDVYDYGGLLGMAWVILGRWLKKKWANPWHSSKAMFCSELVAQVLLDSGYPGAAQFDPPTTDPELLLKFFEKEAEASSTDAT